MTRLALFVFGVTVGIWIHDEVMQWADAGPGVEPETAPAVEEQSYDWTKPAESDRMSETSIGTLPCIGAKKEARRTNGGPLGTVVATLDLRPAERAPAFVGGTDNSARTVQYMPPAAGALSVLRESPPRPCVRTTGAAGLLLSQSLNPRPGIVKLERKTPRSG
jgi:hypothetical protein